VKLKTAYFPKAITLEMWAFQGCGKLRTAFFPKAITVNSFAFEGCGKLRTAYFPKARSVETFAFFLCRKLKLAHFPRATTIGSCAFVKCDQLKTAIFPQVTTIGSSAFESCVKLRTAHFSRATTIVDNAFTGCDNLRYIVLPEVLSVDERKRIGLSDNVVMIAAKYFDKSLMESVEYELIEKLYSQGPVVAKALLTIAGAELISWGSLIDILKVVDFKKHPKIYALVKSILERSDEIIDNDKHNEQAEVSKSESENQQINTELSISALTIFSKHFSSKTSKNYRTSQRSLERVKGLKEMLLRLTGVTQGELDRLKQGREDSLSKTVLEAIDLPSPKPISTLRA
jgi:hypothetical protein